MSHDEHQGSNIKRGPGDEESRIEPWEAVTGAYDSLWRSLLRSLQLRAFSSTRNISLHAQTNADVIDVFNALADTKGEVEWDDLLMNGPGVTYLGDFPNEFARAAAVSFVARPFPDRQVFQWMVYNSTKNYDDMTVVYSTRRNAVLHQRGVEDEGWPAVQAQNCLGAYHVVALPQGGCHVVFTTMVNSHPPWPITAQFVFNIAWTKTAEYIEKLRARAQLLKRRRLSANAPAEPVVPRWLLFDGMVPNKTESGDMFVEGVPKVVPPFQGPDYVADVIQIDLLKDLENVIRSGKMSSMWICAALLSELGCADGSNGAPVPRKTFAPGLALGCCDATGGCQDLVSNQMPLPTFATLAALAFEALLVVALMVSAVAVWRRQRREDMTNVFFCGPRSRGLLVLRPAGPVVYGVADALQRTAGHRGGALVIGVAACGTLRNILWNHVQRNGILRVCARAALAHRDIIEAGNAHVETTKSPCSPIPEFYLEVVDSPNGRHKREMSDAVAEMHASFCAFQEQNQIFAPAAPMPLPVLIVTGSLGSGKTTLMKRLMNRRANLRIAALAHDLASKLNIDASFLAAEIQPGLGKGEYLFQSAWRDGEVAGLSGCACCPGFDEALSMAVKTALNEGADRGLLDYLLLETSGAADPRQIVSSLEVRFGPLARVRLDRVVTVVDAERVLAEGQAWLDHKTQAACNSRHRDEHQLQLAQLLVADVVLLNKVDLCSEEPKALELLRQLCPHAKVLSCSFGDVPVPELLDVVPVPVSASATVSHEDIPACWQVSTSLESSRQSRLLEELPADLSTKFHHRVVEWSTRGKEAKPVQLARLQSLLCVHLHRIRRWLRRAKGMLWVAEDAQAQWEWELSGQLRFSCRRTPGGFGGAEAFSSLVLIFADGVPEAELLNTQRVLAELTLPAEEMVPPKDILQQLAEGSVGFEILGCSTDRDSCVRFRLTGRRYFNLDSDLDLADPPYRIDLDALNQDLAQLVNAEKGPIFLATGAPLKFWGDRHFRLAA
ncbi:unnamed protein product [Symbiodinium natans]|uniref:CobW/HypB/UreG nucleotide-binding domain-containing protein n=1 Tax=Symbiodinium natans TaxID=878477 RepID=A0A812R061_9DINO|nr:unnamed protein product [Symbiodinium natans]